MNSTNTSWLYKYEKFEKLFGRILIDTSTPGGSHFAYFRHVDKNNKIRYDLSYISDQEVEELLIKSEEEEQDYLYEAVKQYAFKDRPLPPDLPPDAIIR